VGERQHRWNADRCAVVDLAAAVSRSELAALVPQAADRLWPVYRDGLVGRYRDVLFEVFAPCSGFSTRTSCTVKQFGSAISSRR
jgi:hypothetical protein